MPTPSRGHGTQRFATVSGCHGHGLAWAWENLAALSLTCGSRVPIRANRVTAVRRAQGLPGAEADARGNVVNAAVGHGHQQSARRGGLRRTVVRFADRGRHLEGRVSEGGGVIVPVVVVIRVVGAGAGVGEYIGPLGTGSLSVTVGFVVGRDVGVGIIVPNASVAFC